MCRKPGAFARYRYRQWFYPSPLWRECYDYLQATYSERRASSEYLNLLRLTLEEPVEKLELLLKSLLEDDKLTLDRVRAELGKQEDWRGHCLDCEPHLCGYDNLVDLAWEGMNHG